MVIVFVVVVVLPVFEAILFIAELAMLPPVFIAELAMLPPVFIAELAMFPTVDDVLPVFEPVVVVVLPLFVITAVLLAIFDILAGLLVLVVLVVVSQAIPIAPKTKTADNTKVFFILINSPVFFKDYFFNLTAKRSLAPNDLILEHSTI